MTAPMSPRVGMRVVYGRSGFGRIGWRGVVTRVTSSNFSVSWDEVSSAADDTVYRSMAWANTRFENRYRDRDVHYIFFDEEHKNNLEKFPTVFDCGNKGWTKSTLEATISELKACTLTGISLEGIPTPTTENEMNKTLVEQTLVNGNNLAEAHEEKLISLICDLEGNIKHLKAIQAKSTKIASLIKEKEKAVAAVVKELDSRD